MNSTVSLPVVCYLYGKVTIHNDTSFKMIGAQFLDDKKFVVKENRRRKAKDGWLVDSEGRFISLSYIGAKQEWARPLAFLWNLVLSEYEVTLCDTITVGKMLDKLEALPKSSLGAVGADFQKFLNKNEKNVQINENLLNRWPL